MRKLYLKVIVQQYKWVGIACSQPESSILVTWYKWTNQNRVLSHSILMTSQIPSGRLCTSFIAGVVVRHAVNSLIKTHSCKMHTIATFIYNSHVNLFWFCTCLSLQLVLLILLRSRWANIRNQLYISLDRVVARMFDSI